MFILRIYIDPVFDTVKKQTILTEEWLGLRLLSTYSSIKFSTGPTTLTVGKKIRLTRLQL